MPAEWVESKFRGKRQNAPCIVIKRSRSPMSRRRAVGPQQSRPGGGSGTCPITVLVLVDEVEPVVLVAVLDGGVEVDDVGGVGAARTPA